MYFEVELGGHGADQSGSDRKTERCDRNTSPKEVRFGWLRRRKIDIGGMIFKAQRSGMWSLKTKKGPSGKVHRRITTFMKILSLQHYEEMFQFPLENCIVQGGSTSTTTLSTSTLCYSKDTVTTTCSRKKRAISDEPIDGKLLE